MGQLEALSLGCGEPNAIKRLHRTTRWTGRTLGTAPRRWACLSTSVVPLSRGAEGTGEPTPASRDTLEISGVSGV